jgi:hypothetical protein
MLRRPSVASGESTHHAPTSRAMVVALIGDVASRNGGGGATSPRAPVPRHGPGATRAGAMSVRPRCWGSPSNLIGRLSALGLEPYLRRGEGTSPLGRWGDVMGAQSPGALDGPRSPPHPCPELGWGGPGLVSGLGHAAHMPQHIVYKPAERPECEAPGRRSLGARRDPHVGPAQRWHLDGGHRLLDRTR